MKRIFCFLAFFALPVYGNTDSLPDKATPCYQAFQEKHYSPETMEQHLSTIKRRNHIHPFSKTFVSLLDGRRDDSSPDPAFQGSIIRIIGDINRQNRPTMISKLLKRLQGKRSHYLERKGAIQALGHLLKPGDTKDIKQLSKNLQDRASDIRKETALALRNIRPENLPKMNNN